MWLTFWILVFDTKKVGKKKDTLNTKKVSTSEGYIEYKESENTCSVQSKWIPNYTEQFKDRSHPRYECKIQATLQNPQKIYQILGEGSSNAP